jgi:hypothetical protein
MTCLWQGTKTTTKEQWNLAGQTIPQIRTMTYNNEAAPGAGVIMSWQPDCSPQVMTVITTAESSENQIWDNVQPGHTCDWDCLTMSPDLILCLKLKLVPQRWAKVLTLLLPIACPGLCKKISFLCLSPCLFILHIGVSGHPYMQVFEPGIQNSGSDITSVHYIHVWKCQNKAHYFVQLIHANKKEKNKVNVIDGKRTSVTQNQREICSAELQHMQRPVWLKTRWRKGKWYLWYVWRSGFGLDHCSTDSSMKRDGFIHITLGNLWRALSKGVIRTYLYWKSPLRLLCGTWTKRGQEEAESSKSL